MHHFFAWKDEGGHWRGNRLLSRSQINALLRTLEGHYEIFESIQTYSEQESILSCPLYADFDHKDQSLERVKADVQTLVFRMIQDLSATPEVHFSGNKGFHIILPIELKGERCHEISKEIMTSLAGDLRSLDKSVYRPRAMFRLPRSKASRAGFFKVEITIEELFNAPIETIQRLSANPKSRSIPKVDSAKFNHQELEKLVREATWRLPERRARSLLASPDAPQITPCIQEFLDKGTKSGARNRVVFLLAKHFRLSGVSQEEALRELLGRPHFAEWENERAVDLASVVRSVYRSPKEPIMGCRTGADADLMKTACSPFCRFSREDTGPIAIKVPGKKKMA